MENFIEQINSKSGIDLEGWLIDLYLSRHYCGESKSLYEKIKYIEELLSPEAMERAYEEYIEAIGPEDEEDIVIKFLVESLDRA